MSGVLQGSMSFNAKSGKVGVGPQGTVQKQGRIVEQQTSGGTSYAGTLGGTGWQTVPFSNYDPIQRGSGKPESFKNPFLSLSANRWTLELGFYMWEFYRSTHQSNHIWTAFVRYGNADGTGSGIGNVTASTPETSQYMSFKYDGGQSTIDTHLWGYMEVVDERQKYQMRQYTEINSQHGSGNMSTAGNQVLLRNMFTVWKIGA